MFSDKVMQSKKGVKSAEALQRPVQLELFELTVGSERCYSNTIEFWDVIPKFFYGRMNRRMMVDEKSNSVMHVLPSLVRKFRYTSNGMMYKIIVSPAILVAYDAKTKQNVSTYYYPSTREELVEEVLRKYIAMGHGGFTDDNDVSVSFSLRSIQMDLAQSGHTYSLVEVREALNIMSKTNIEIRLEGGGFEYKGNILVTLALARQGSGVRCFCSLNPLVSQAIRNLRFRTYDYTKCISYQTPLSRYLHKRISHYYKQAEQKNPYTIMLSTLFNDSGHSMHSEVPRNKPKMEMVLSELAAKNVITTYKISPILEKKVKPKILDYKVDLTPSIDFINEIISANKREGANLLKMGLPTLE